MDDSAGTGPAAAGGDRWLSIVDRLPTDPAVVLTCEIAVDTRNDTWACTGRGRSTARRRPNGGPRTHACDES